eukprot:Hpha_TRINITY_DN6855_c0_g1::TRINITY_DN6855_c0_g1_i1::g.46261::m.46261/K00477/PHYH; phytanoyl-CoA hydroxylase
MGLTPEQRRFFDENGYLVFPAVLPPSELSRYRGILEGLVKKAEQIKEQGDWNATGGLTLLNSSDGGVQAGRLHKVQSLCLHEPRMRELIAQPNVHGAVRELIGDAARNGLDAFGTKFFPVLPTGKGLSGGYSVGWHQDNYFFGTDSSKIVSCGWYLEDTDAENGCLRVIPGSHKAATVAPHESAKSSGEDAGKDAGEWIRDVDDTKAVDVKVPAGSCVIFNSLIWHTAHRNSSASRSRYSCFWHFLPSDLQFAWRGVDFSRGKYADRHEISTTPRASL